MAATPKPVRKQVKQEKSLIKSRMKEHEKTMDKYAPPKKAQAAKIRHKLLKKGMKKVGKEILN